MTAHPDAVDVDRLTADEPRGTRSAWWSETFTHVLCRILELTRRDRVLDVGCGTGILVDRLLPAGFGFVQVFGVDIGVDIGGITRTSAAMNSSGLSIQAVPLFVVSGEVPAAPH